MSDEAKKWREARRKYLGVEEEVPRIVEDARRQLESMKEMGGRIEYAWFRNTDSDVEMEKVAAIVWLADELAKRPQLKVLNIPQIAPGCADQSLGTIYTFER